MAAVAAMLLSPPARSSALEQGSLTGSVADTAGAPVRGAVISLYFDLENLRRRPDFVSSATDGDGRFMLAVPPGRYWAVARLKKNDIGPLMPGDKHSGDPVEVEIAAGVATTTDFVVMDLKEAMRLKRKEREDALRISGRIIDSDRNPVPDAYVFAKSPESLSALPDYFSAWTDEQGRYTLYLPAGRYALAPAVTFPPEPDASPTAEMTFDADRTDIDIVMGQRTGK